MLTAHFDFVHTWNFIPLQPSTICYIIYLNKLSASIARAGGREIERDLGSEFVLRSKCLSRKKRRKVLSALVVCFVSVVIEALYVFVL